jgi:hypothetical protein
MIENWLHLTQYASETGSLTQCDVFGAYKRQFDYLSNS